ARQAEREDREPGRCGGPGPSVGSGRDAAAALGMVLHRLFLFALLVRALGDHVRRVPDGRDVGRHGRRRRRVARAARVAGGLVHAAVDRLDLRALLLARLALGEVHRAAVDRRIVALERDLLGRADVAVRAGEGDEILAGLEEAG